MIGSLNEIEATVRRAAAGVGLPPGLAEDAGRTAAWLAVSGLDDLAAVRRALDGCLPATSSRPDGVGTWLSALRAGPPACDLARVRPDSPVVLRAVDEPLLIAAAAGIATDPDGMLWVTWRAGDAAVAVECAMGRPSVRVTGRTDAPEIALRSGGADVRVGATAPGEAVTGPEWLSPGDFEARLGAILETGFACPDETWTALTGHAARFLVPASAESRLKGAGAGLIDTD